MSVSLTVNGVSYDYPVENDQQWGSEATDWAIAVTDALASVTVPGDLPPPAVNVTIQNNQSVAQNVTDLVFDPGDVRAAEIEYWVYRLRDADERMESGTLRVRYKTNSGTWSLDQTYGGDETGTVFDITAGGQVTYTTDNMTGSGGAYVGQMSYRAYALPS